MNRFQSLRPYTPPTDVLDIFRRELDAAYDEGGHLPADDASAHHRLPLAHLDPRRNHPPRQVAKQECGSPPMPRSSPGRSSTRLNDRSGASAAARCGYVALIGAPNAGKSTLLNRLVGQKLAIVTPKAQTTRSRMLGIAIEGAIQIVYVDTPGIFAPRRRLDRAMVAAAWSGTEDADKTVLLVDAARGIDRDTGRSSTVSPSAGASSILALEQDRSGAPRQACSASPRRWRAMRASSPVFMISGLNGDGVDDLQSAPRRRPAAGAMAVPGGPALRCARTADRGGGDPRAGLSAIA